MVHIYGGWRCCKLGRGNKATIYIVGDWVESSFKWRPWHSLGIVFFLVFVFLAFMMNLSVIYINSSRSSSTLSSSSSSHPQSGEFNIAAIWRWSASKYYRVLQIIGKYCRVLQLAAIWRWPASKPDWSVWTNTTSTTFAGSSEIFLKQLQTGKKIKWRHNKEMLPHHVTSHHYHPITRKTSVCLVFWTAR